MSSPPLFFVMTVCLNNLSGLRRTYESLRRQTCSNFEWIVIDGGSADGTQRWLEKTRVRWVSEPDKGLYDAMNKGLERAGGEYLIFLNAGDSLAGPETLANIASAIRDADAVPDFIYGDSCETAPGGRKFYKRAKSHERISRGMFTHHQAMIYRREAVGELRYDLRYEIAADYDFTCRFLLDTKHRHCEERPRRSHPDSGLPRSPGLHPGSLAMTPCILYLPFPLCLFEGGGTSQQKAPQGRSEQFRIRRRLGIGNPLTNGALHLAQTLTWHLRRLFPGLYWRLKSSGNSGRGSGQR